MAELANRTEVVISKLTYALYILNIISIYGWNDIYKGIWDIEERLRRLKAI